MTSLIVDFPSKRMVLQELPAERSVRFAETSTLTFIEPSTRGELATMWYSNNKHHRQRRLFKLHAHTLSKKLLTTPMSLINQEVIYKCIRMEVSSSNFLLASLFSIINIHLTLSLCDRLFYPVMSSNRKYTTGSAMSVHYLQHKHAKEL